MNSQGCLNQTGANCFFKFDFWGGAGTEGRGRLGWGAGQETRSRRARGQLRPRCDVTWLFGRSPQGAPVAAGGLGPSGRLIILIKGTPLLQGAGAQIRRAPPLISIIIGVGAANPRSPIRVVL